MSYGRRPYYIYSDGESVHFHDASDNHTPVDAIVPIDALAQFVASMAARGTDVLNDWIARGAAVREGTFTPVFRAEVIGGFRSNRGEDMSMYSWARQVTDEVLGEGSYDELNRTNPDPGVQAVIEPEKDDDAEQG